MKYKWAYLSGCFVAPHIMLAIGLLFLGRSDLEHKDLGLRLCKLSAAVLVIGSLIYYYVFFTPITGTE